MPQWTTTKKTLVSLLLCVWVVRVLGNNHQNAQGAQVGLWIIFFFFVILLSVWYKKYIKLFSTVYLCFPLAMVANSSKEKWIFLLMILRFLFHYVLMCLHVERSYGSRVEPMALEKSLNLSEPLFLYRLHENSDNNNNDSKTSLSLCRGAQDDMEALEMQLMSVTLHHRRYCQHHPDYHWK